jgi:hypothetical protein
MPTTATATASSSFKEFYQHLPFLSIPPSHSSHSNKYIFDSGEHDNSYSWLDALNPFGCDDDYSDADSYEDL